MLDPSLVTNAVVTALQSIPALVTAMGGSAGQIYAHHFYYGAEDRLSKALFEITPPSILVAWVGTQGGNFDGMTIWKHRVNLYIRAANVAGSGSPVGYEHLWCLICNGGPVHAWDGSGGSSSNIRTVQIFNGLDIMDTPSIGHQVDEEQMDYFVGTFVFPEIGDQ